MRATSGSGAIQNGWITAAFSRLAMTIWKLSVMAPSGTVTEIEAHLTDAVGAALLSISDFEQPGGGRRLEALLDRNPAELGLNSVLRALIDDGNMKIAPVEMRDWVAESQAALAPIRAGRFFVHGGHDAGKVPAGAIGLRIEAAQAFGTGHHATTLGCLLALDDILKWHRPRTVLDLGCGTGILAMAAAKALKRPVIASDIDPVAVRITRENARFNGARVTAAAAGFDHAILRKSGPYDLIMANILAEPLTDLAPTITRALRPGGLVILSGILTRQAGAVRAAYVAAGLKHQRRRAIQGWATLVMQKPSRGATRRRVS